MFLKIWKISQACNFIKRHSNTGVLLGEISEIFKNTYFEEYLQTTVSAIRKLVFSHSRDILAGSLIRFRPMSYFSPSWKHKKTGGFLSSSWCMKFGGIFGGEYASTFRLDEIYTQTNTINIEKSRLQEGNLSQKLILPQIREEKCKTSVGMSTI